jgi:hypothetical protein
MRAPRRESKERNKKKHLENFMTTVLRQARSGRWRTAIARGKIRE